MKLVTPKEAKKRINVRRSTELDTIRTELQRELVPRIESQLDYIVKERVLNGTRLNHEVDKLYFNEEFRVGWYIRELFKDKEAVHDVMNKMLCNYNWELETTHYMAVADRIDWDMIVKPMPIEPSKTLREHLIHIGRCIYVIGHSILN